MTTIIAIDPGVSGGIAWNSMNEGVQACCMPREEESVIKLLREIIQVNVDHRIVAYIELVTGYVKIDKDEDDRENRQPGHTMFKFGRGVGVLVGALKMAGLEPREVSPRTWQKPFYVNLSKPNAQRKGRSERKRILRDIAQRRFQQLEVTLKTADALLIHAYASMMESQEFEAIAVNQPVAMPMAFTEKHTKHFSQLKRAVAEVPGNGMENFSGGLPEPEVQSKSDLHINRNAGTWNDSDERRGTRFPAAKPLGGALCGKVGNSPSLGETKNGSDKFHAQPAQNALTQNPLADRDGESQKSASFYIIDWKGAPYVVAPDQDQTYRMIRQASPMDVANLPRLTDKKLCQNIETEQFQCRC